MIEAFADAHQKKAQLDAATLTAITRRLDELERSADQSSARRPPRPGNDEGSQGHLRCAARDARSRACWAEIFPDFEEIRCRVIRDFFHKYTVDEHSLIAIRNIEQLPASHRFSVLLNELENPELLLLSLLFHDIGKSHRHDEGNHVHPSTEGVKVILEKLEMPPEQAEKVVFVVKDAPRNVEDHLAPRFQRHAGRPAVCRHGRQSSRICACCAC